MKKLIINFWSWLKSLFSKKSVQPTPVVEKTKEQLLFEKLEGNGFFKKEEEDTEGKRLEDLKVSAQKLNHYKDVRLSIESNITTGELDGLKKTESFKDKVKLKRIEMALDKKTSNEVESTNNKDTNILN